jgi:hypothetical protein
VTGPYCCRSCWQVVDTYKPTGTNVLVALDHPFPGTDGSCPGAGWYVDPIAVVERERAANAAWRAARADRSAS